MKICTVHIFRNVIEWCKVNYIFSTILKDIDIFQQFMYVVINCSWTKQDAYWIYMHGYQFSFNFGVMFNVYLEFVDKR